MSCGALWSVTSRAPDAASTMESPAKYETLVMSSVITIAITIATMPACHVRPIAKPMTKPNTASNAMITSTSTRDRRRLLPICW